MTDEEMNVMLGVYSSDDKSFWGQFAKLSIKDRRAVLERAQRRQPQVVRHAPGGAEVSTRINADDDAMPPLAKPAKKAGKKSGVIVGVEDGE